jgi:DNA-binding Xre family transcriptional regulator
MRLSTRVGRNLKRLRLQRGWSQLQLAVNTPGVGVKTVQKLESGKGAKVKLAALDALAQALECTVQDLLRPAD